MLVHICRLPNNARIQDQLSYQIRGELLRFRTQADYITSIGVLHEIEIQLNTYVAIAGACKKYSKINGATIFADDSP